jgi:hypothetical protein
MIRAKSRTNLLAHINVVAHGSVGAAFCVTRAGWLCGLRTVGEAARSGVEVRSGILGRVRTAEGGFLQRERGSNVSRALIAREREKNIFDCMALTANETKPFGLKHSQQTTFQ